MARDIKAGNGIQFDDTTEGELLISNKALIAQVAITHPEPAYTVAVTGTGNTGLNPAIYESSFVDVLNGYTESFNADGVFTVLPDGRVQINKTGTIFISGYADIYHSANNSTVGVAFSIERNSVRVLSPRSVHARMPNGGDIGNISGCGVVAAQVGDIIGIALASSVTGTISFSASALVYDFKG